ncbi:MAG: AMP-binding protein [Spirochaetaceae bacterium]|nr:AMP-binding protein [Spirochaetaceae bacterium]
MKRTVLRMLDEAAQNWTNDPFALKKTDQGYQASSFSQVRTKAREFGAWLLLKGYSRSEAFALLGEGSPEWIIAEFGLLCAGLISVPLSIKLLSDEIVFRLDHSESKGIITTHNQLEKALGALKNIQTREARLVYMDTDLDWALELVRKAGFPEDQFITLETASLQGREALARKELGLESRLDTINRETEEDDVATISYTSGTTGNPKGIMLTQLNYWSNCHDAKELFDNPIHFRTLLVLPVDHSFAHTVGIYTALICGISLYFVDSRGGGIATLRNIPVNLKEANPIFLLTVPSLSGNFMKKIIAGVEEKGGIAERLFKSGIAAGIRWNGDGFHTASFKTRIGAFFPYFCAKLLVFGEVKKAAFGDSIRFCVGGGATLDVKQQEFFAALGVPVYQGYGLTESAPIISSNVPRKHKFGSSGIIGPSVECKIMNEKGEEMPQGATGEITITGENVMKGYFKNQKASEEALRGGRLWTGDLGYIDEDGFLVVVGREKALLIAEDGEKYSPEEIEEAVTTSTDMIDQIMVWCDHKKYSCALVTLDTAKVAQLIKQKGIGTAEELCRALQDEFYAFRQDPKAKKVQKAWIPAAFQILDTAFSDRDGTINSTMKLVRYRVSLLYEDRLEYSYMAEGSTTVNPRNIETLRTLFPQLG